MRRHGIYNTRTRKAQRKLLRNESTAPEAVLWVHLQRRQIDGKKFRRQYSVGPYIFDFYCPECRLAVELDGARHFQCLGPEYDAHRTEYMMKRGIRVIRFENREVYSNLEHVLQTIRNELSGFPS